jgi:hypothetical protein
MSIFKQPFPDFVKKQLKLREDIVSKTIRTPDAHHFITARTPFVRMSSSVNIISPEAPKGSDALARKNVLFGGEAIYNGNGNYQLKNGFNTTDGAYKKGPLGIRPMAGVNSLSVKNRGAYGSLRELTVNFTCWDIRQLEELEVLYMRPGFTVLVEWGWTTYLKDIDGKLNKSHSPEYYDLFDNRNAGKTIQQIVKELRVKSELSQGNYDAHFGKIKNYQWSARSDGGFDCTTTVVSLGEILESLKVNYVAPQIDVYKIAENGYIFEDPTKLIKFQQRNDLTNSYKKSTLAGAFHEMHAIFSTSEPTSSFASGSGDDYIISAPNNPDSLAFIDWFAVKDPGGIIVSEEDQKHNIVFDGIQTYITLESLCNMLNIKILPRNTVIISTKATNNNGVEEDNLCLYNPLQISVDPSICLINAPLWQTGIQIPETTGSLDQAKIQDAKVGVTNKDDIILAHNTMVGILKGVLQQAPDGKDIDEGDIHKQLNDYFSGSKNIEDAKNRVVELQKQFESLKGNTKSVNEFIAEDKEIQGAKLNDNDIEDTNMRIYMFDNVAPDLVFNNIIRLRRYNAHSRASRYDIYDVLIDNQDWLTVLRENDEVNFMDFLEKFDYGSNLLIKQNIEDNLHNKGMNREDARGFLGGIIGNISTADDIMREQERIKEAVKNINSNKNAVKYLQNLPKKFIDAAIAPEKGIIGNIYINLNYLYKLSLNNALQEGDKQEKRDINLYDFMKQILHDVQGSIGNINNFEIQVDNNIARIIDINYLDKSTPFLDAHTINVQNDRSIVRHYSHQSHIYPEQSTIIAIAAQDAPNSLNVDSSTLNAYRKNIVDRILTANEATDVPAGGGIRMNNQEALISIGRILGNLAQFFTGSNNSKDTAPDYKNALKDLIFFIRNNFGNSDFNVIIPTKLSVTMDGIGGIIIGNLFKISPNALPKGYKGGEFGRQVGFIVTDLSHEVKNDGWLTTIGAQTIIIEQPSGSFFPYNEITFDATPETKVNENAENVMKSVGSLPSNYYINNIYIPTLDRTLPSVNKATKIFLTAHAKKEGFFPGSPAYRNNNPGNFTGEVAGIKSLGHDPKNKKFVKYGTLDAGIKTQYAQLQVIASGRSNRYPKDPTLWQYMNIYAPPSENDTRGYTDNIIAEMKAAGYNVTDNTKISEILKFA